MHIQPILALVVVQLLFGALPVASKFVLAHAHPFFVVVLRSLFASIFFFVLHKVFSAVQRPSAALDPSGVGRDGDTADQRLPLSVHARILLLAFFGITFNQMALFIALPQTTAAVASIISPSIALFTLLFSVLLGRENFRTSSLLSIVLGGVGVLLVINPFTQSLPAAGASGAAWADSLNVLSAASYAFYLALVGQLPTRVGGLRFSLLFFVYGCLLNVLVMLLFAQATNIGLLERPKSLLLNADPALLPASFWFGLGFLLLGATALTYFLNTWALQRVKPSLVGGFVCLQTLFGLFLSQIILSEPITLPMMLGSLLIMGGVVVLTIQHFRDSRRTRAADGVSA